jgi:hypothetical protein
MACSNFLFTLLQFRVELCRSTFIFPRSHRIALSAMNHIQDDCFETLY